MSKKKSGSTPKPATAPKAPRAERKPWATKQLERVGKLSKLAARLGEFFTKANPPGEHAASLQSIGDATSKLTTQLLGLSDFKPTAKGKPSVGATIKVKTESETAPVFAAIPSATFAGATVTGDDGQDWIVRCSDGVVRVLKKKYAQLL